MVLASEVMWFLPSKMAEVCGPYTQMDGKNLLWIRSNDGEGTGYM